MQSIERRLAVLEEQAVDRSLRLVVIDEDESIEQCVGRLGLETPQRVIFCSAVDELL